MTGGRYRPTAADELARQAAISLATAKPGEFHCCEAAISRAEGAFHSYSLTSGFDCLTVLLPLSAVCALALAD